MILYAVDYEYHHDFEMNTLKTLSSLLLMDYLNLYNESQRKRHLVKPGLTGWAQINGGNDLPWEKKFEYDLDYVERLSFYFDLKIIAITIWKIITLKGFNTGKIIIGKFKGNSN